MENAPGIILFWYFIIAIFVLMIAFMIAAIILIKNVKNPNAHKMKLLGKVCAVLGHVCAVPIILVVGYIIYLYIG